MTGCLHICRYCDEPIDPADKVFVGHEPGNSGPGWDIWAHREHVELLRPDPIPTNILARVLMARISTLSRRDS